MKSIDLMYQTMLAELGQRSLDAAWTADFPPEGRFTPANIKGRKYWYFDIPDGHGGTKRRYVGSAEDPDIARRVADHKRDKDDLRARRRLVNTLTREGGMVAPDAMSGDIVEALADGGLFRLGGVLVGTVAFQCYSGLLGVRLPMAAILTGDADIAQDYAISREVEDSLPPIVELLQSVQHPLHVCLGNLHAASISNLRCMDVFSSSGSSQPRSTSRRIEVMVAGDPRPLILAWASASAMTCSNS